MMEQVKKVTVRYTDSNSHDSGTVTFPVDSNGPMGMGRIYDEWVDIAERYGLDADADIEIVFPSDGWSMTTGPC